MRKSEASEKNYPQISQTPQIILFWLCHVRDLRNLWMLFVHDFVGAFKMSVDEGFRESLTADMARTGYLETERVVLGLWPGLADPVLIDGHTRRAAAIAAGIERIPYEVVKFESEIEGLRYSMSVQCKRRPRKDDVIFRFVERYDTLMSRGRRRQSEEAKELPTSVGNSGRSASAQRMAMILGSNRGKVEKARKILKDGTPEIQDAVKNGKLTISKAYNLVIKKQVVRRRSGDIKLKPWTLAALRELGGSIEDHVEAAVQRYVEWLRGEDGLTSEGAEHAENGKT